MDLHDIPTTSKMTIRYLVWMYNHLPGLFLSFYIITRIKHCNLSTQGIHTQICVILGVKYVISIFLTDTLRKTNFPIIFVSTRTSEWRCIHTGLSSTKSHIQSLLSRHLWLQGSQYDCLCRSRAHALVVYQIGVFAWTYHYANDYTHTYNKSSVCGQGVIIGGHRPLVDGGAET